MQFIDTHTHLYLDAFAHDIDNVIALAIEKGVSPMLLPDIDSTSRNAMLALASKYPQHCRNMLGLHPTSVKENYKDELTFLEKILSHHPCIAIGETGIDLYWDKTFIDEQIESFEFQIECAIKLNLPVVIHSRKSLNEVFSILKKYKNRNLKGVFHCFPGNVMEAQRVIEMGFLLGIGGVVTYKNSSLADVVKNIDLQHILLETDAPFLSPAPHRGKRNESSFIPDIAAFIAKTKNIDIAAVAEITTQTATQLFQLN